MRFIVIGAGAMGCLIGGKLQQAGHDVAYLARGAQLHALQRDGLALEPDNGKIWHANVSASDKAQDLGTAAALLLTTKAYQLPDIAPLIPPLLGKDTVVVPMTNGLPWWYFFKRPGAFSDRPLASLDPHGALAQHIPIARIVGGVNYLAGTQKAPGHVWYVNELARRIALGELDGSMSPRLNALCDAFDVAGFAARRSEDIRQVIWHKLWGNLAFNPVSALTGATQDEIAGFTDISVLKAAMDEGRAVADKLGILLDQTTESRIAAAAKMKGHRTSMYSDITQGKKTEIDAIAGVVREIAGWLSVPTPHLDTLYTLVRMKERYAPKSSATSGQG